MSFAQVIFPHHRPLDRDRKHFERAVCRCQKARMYEGMQIEAFVLQILPIELIFWKRAFLDLHSNL